MPATTCTFHNAREDHHANLMIKYLAAVKLAHQLGCLRLSNFKMPYWGIDIPALEEAEARKKITLGDQLFINSNRVKYLIEDVGVDWIDWLGYGQRMELLPDRAFSSSQFQPPHEAGETFGDGYLVCPVRAGDILNGGHSGYTLLPVSFYKDLAAMTSLKLAFTGQTEPNPYTDQLRKAFPDALFLPSQGALADFQTIRRAQNIVVSVSTFSWLAAWLSNARQIILPMYGLFNRHQFPAHDLLPVGDPRYQFYQFPIQNAVPLSELELAHRAIDGEWFRADIGTLISVD